MGPFDDPTPMHPDEEARHRAEYARLIAQNRARGLGGPAATGHSDTESYEHVDRNAIAHGTWKPYKPPSKADKFWSGVSYVVGILLLLALISGAPIRGA